MNPEIPKPKRCHTLSGQGQKPWGAILTALFLSGCAANTAAEMANSKTASYYEDATTCQTSNPGQTDGTQPGSGLLSINRTGYLECLQGLGYQQDVRTDPLLKAIDKCALGQSTVSAQGERHTVPPDKATFQDCLKQRGFTHIKLSDTPAVPATAPAPGSDTVRSQSVRPASPASEPVQTIYIPRRSHP